MSLLACMAGAAETAPAAAPPHDARLWKKAQELHARAIVVDGHNDILSMMADDGYDLATPSQGRYHTDLARMKQGGLTAEFFSVFVHRAYAEKGAASRALDLIDHVHRAAERHPKDLMLAYTVADIRRAKKKGRIAVLIGVEGGHAIEDSLTVLRGFYRLGARYMTLTHNNTNHWADACCDAAKHQGLSEFGREVVLEMNRIGMLVDISHVSDEAMSDVLDVSRAPIIFSHSSARALAGHPRNVPDEILRRIAKNDGLVMVNFYSNYIDPAVLDAAKARDERLKPQMEELTRLHGHDPARLQTERSALHAAHPLPATSLGKVVDHIDHIVKVSGIDHVGLGSDFDGVPSLPEGLHDVAQLPHLTYELLRRGYSESDTRKILGESFLRVFAEAERVARGSSVSGDGSLKRMAPATP